MKTIRTASTCFAYLLISLLYSCAAFAAENSPPSSESEDSRTAEYKSVPCVHVGDTHILRVPVTINGTINTQFILDTGAGVNLVSKELAQKLGCKIADTYQGRRMSGQTINVEISHISSIALGGYTKSEVPVGLWNMKELFENAPQFANIEGIVSLNFFKDCALTVDYSRQEAKIEDAESLAARAGSGVVVPIKVSNKKGLDTSVMLKMQLPKQQRARCEVDTGSGALILDRRYMKSLGIEPDAKSVRKVSGKDETNHSYTRYFTKLDGDVHPLRAASIKQNKPSVQFQEIIYDGLVGDDFLRNFTVTYDIPNSRMIFSK